MNNEKGKIVPSDNKIIKDGAGLLSRFTDVVKKWKPVDRHFETQRKPIFLLGVGAQKAGTSWLHKQLNAQSCADFGCLKEYHVWDAMFSPLCKTFLAGEKKHEGAAHKLRRRMQTQERVYEDYFKGLISKKIFLTGDITPSYSLLQAEDFSHIRSRLENVGFDVKVIFLMRDPVERIWSSLRMGNREQKKHGIGLSKTQLIDRFVATYKGVQHVKRTRYDRTVCGLREAFDSDSLYFDFYEQLFDEAATMRLARFLDIKINRFNYGEKINRSKPLALPKDVELEAREYFSQVYTFCNAEFSDSIRLWNKDH